MSEVWLRLPSRHLFQFPPSPEPQVLPSPQQPPSFAQPFTIDPELYNAALDIRVPLTIASVYAVTVTILNAINRRRGHKAWYISKTRPFFAFVIAHNVFLALYSAWTCLGMINAIRTAWPGWNGAEGLPEIVDAFCKLHGPRGFGDAVSRDYMNSKWSVGNSAIKLLNDQPDPTDVGRLWNGGLAFYGWLFYISKFYEVIDTLVILAKGKKSSFLQTYHHAGAMLCMWAGIRYMSPPIWMFCLVNSGIHALMYTYYTISAFGVRVPGVMKRTLTTVQIAQFLVGFAYAGAHLFIAYKTPIQSPYVYYHNIATALPSATSVIASAAATADMNSWLKKAVLRAAGDEGLSANVRNRNGNLFGHSGEQAVLAEAGVLNKAKEEIRYRLEYVNTNCIDTSGQSFAIYLNLLYLLPLTGLFLRFFVKSYLRSSSGGKLESQARRFGKSGYDAARDVEKEVVKAMRRDRGSAFTSPAHSDVEASSPTSPSHKKNKNKLSMTKIVDQISDGANDLVAKGVNGAKQLSDNVKKSDAYANAKDFAEKTGESIQNAVGDLTKKAEKGVNDVESALKQASEDKLGDDHKEPDETAESAKSPSKKKKKHKHKHQHHATEPHNSSQEHAEPLSYAEAAAKEPQDDNTDVPHTEKPHAEEPHIEGPHAEEPRAEESHAEEETKVSNEEDSIPSGGDPLAQSYETSIDEIMTEEQKEAEAEMQPEGLSNS